MGEAEEQSVLPLSFHRAFLPSLAEALEAGAGERAVHGRTEGGTRTTAFAFSAIVIGSPPGN